MEHFILILGAMKSGTTTLFDLLGEHPAIAPCFPKEPGFFAFEDRWAEGFEWYENLFDFDPDRHTFGLDGSTDYAKHPFCSGIADRLAASAPRRFKLIYVVRDPFERLESHARHVQMNRKEVGQFPSVRPDHSLDNGISPVSLAVSRHATQLDHYRSFYDAGDLIIVKFEDLISDQSGTMQKLYAFLGLDAHEGHYVHSNDASAQKTDSDLWRTLNGLGVLTTIAKWIVPKPLRNLLRERLKKPVVAEGRFQLSADEKQRIAGELEPEFLRLEQEYGVAVSDYLETLRAARG